MKKIIACLFSVLALSACVQSGKPLEKWSNLNQASYSADDLRDDQALIVFYRKDDVVGSPADIYVDGNYQTSIFPNSTSAVRVCANRHLLTSSFVADQKFGNRTKGSEHVSPAKAISYVRLSQNNGSLLLEDVDQETASQEIATFEQTSHVLSRVPAPENCGAALIASKRLDATALFPLNKYSFNHMLPKGRQEVLEFAAHIKGLSNLGTITVEGYTDADGSEKYNQSLSQKRADAVKKALQQAGVTAEINAIGRGEQNQLVQCSGKNKAQRVQCNQPNRRVEISVFAN